MPKHEQLAGLRGWPQLVVATPGRLNDFRENQPTFCDLRGVRFLVLDEADRMLDEGFEPQIRKIVFSSSALQRQTMLFSATWPPAMQKLADDFLRDPLQIRVGSVDQLRANASILQDVQFCADLAGAKTRELVKLLKSRPRARTLVFVATKDGCHELSRQVRGTVPGRCETLHGGLHQERREAALEAFRSGAARVLFATDVAGRGIDVPGIDLVINYDPPRSREDYVHRIGRTGRAGATGQAVSLLTHIRDGDAMKFIAEVMEETGVPVPADLAHRL
ncbi:unnamed protein product, partial [Polarella glacialis]